MNRIIQPGLVSESRLLALESIPIETLEFTLVDAPTSGNPKRLSIQDFQGNFSAVAELMERSWMENSKQSLLYTADFLASCFEYPGATFSLAPTLYEGGTPIAFVAGFPRRVRYKGRELRIILSTFLSVSHEQKKKGYGVILWAELVKRAQAAGFDGMVNYCVEGEAMNGMILGCCRMMKLPTERIFSAHYQMRLLQPKSVPAPKQEPESGAVESFLQASAPIADHVPLARIWSEKEAEWQCRRHGAVVVRHISGSRQGVLTGYLMEITAPQRPKCLLIEDVLWGTLELQEKRALLRQLLDRAAAAGAQMAIVPCLAYADMEPFVSGRFRRSPRIVHAYLTVFSTGPIPETLSSMYLDVL